MKANLILALLIIVGVSSCYYDNSEELYPELQSGCDTTSVTYSTTIAPMLSSYCLGCHSNASANSFGGGIKLENYSDVKTYVDNGKLVGAIKHLSGYSPMPKNAGKLSDCKISQLDIWVNRGAANN